MDGSYYSALEQMGLVPSIASPYTLRIFVRNIYDYELIVADGCR